jgi:hypothetical protein
MAQQGGVAQDPDMQTDFNLAKQAFLDYTTWASTTSPTSDYFQARPCELLRVRALDLSAVPQLTSGVRGVRIFMPADIGLTFRDISASDRLLSDYMRIAQQVMSSYLVSVLQDSEVFKQLWISLVDLYVSGSELRERYMRQCSKEEQGQVTDISFD